MLLIKAAKNSASWHRRHLAAMLYLMPWKSGVVCSQLICVNLNWSFVFFWSKITKIIFFCTTSNFYFPLSFLPSFPLFSSFSSLFSYICNMNSTSGNSTVDPLGLAADTHGSLYKLIGVTLAICSGKDMTSGTSRERDSCLVRRHIYWQQFCV